ncbi:MAG: HAD family hydrolase [Ktedonobacteraceae bacterium]
MDQETFSLPFGTRAILFDLDDTLYDRDAAYADWANVFVQATFPAMNAIQVGEAVALLIELDDHGYASRETIFAGLRQRYTAFTTPLPLWLEEYHCGLLSMIELSQAVSSLLHALAGADLPFGIITNGSARQQRKIEQLGFDQLTSCLFISHLFGIHKPDPAIFLAAADHLQVPPSEILFVGDHPYNDIWGAHRAGMRTAWLRRAFPWPDMLPPQIIDLTLHSLAELL